MRLPKRLGTVLLSLILCASCVAAASPPQSPQPAFKPGNLYIADSVIDNLALLYEQFETEYVMCVLGEANIEERYAFLEDLWMPHHNLSTNHTVHTGTCRPNKRLIGILHNHPGGEGDYCYLSKTDLSSFLHKKHPLTFVQCGPRTIAWWTKAQADSLSDYVLAMPPEGQLVDFAEADTAR